MIYNYFKYTDKGPRNENQDSHEVSIFEASCVACVADGVGGGNCGSLASSLSVETFISKSITSELNELLLNIHDDIKEIQEQNTICKGMATTFTGCIIRNLILDGIHVGDSRLCILRGNGIKQLTHVHTEANRLLRTGKLTKEEYNDYPRKNILESALGISKSLIVQSFQFNLEIRDRVLISSDGFHDIINKREIRDLSVSNQNVHDFGEALVKLLSNKKLIDNVTFVVVEIS
jgi:PPM family protein phosphatase